MAKKPVSAPRLIPNFNMTKPWSDPVSEQELDGLAMTALLSGATDTNRAVSGLLGRFAGDYVENLRKANG